VVVVIATAATAVGGIEAPLIISIRGRRGVFLPERGEMWRDKISTQARCWPDASNEA